MKKALFLDRDGIVNVDTKYLHKVEDFVFVDGIFELCINAQKKGYIIVIITNQAGVAKGYFSEDDVKVLHDWMRKRFAEKGIFISGVYYCPYHINGIVKQYKKNSDCRKPKPGMFLQAAKEHDINITSSIMVGDKNSDRIELPGLKSIIVKSKYVESGFDVISLSEVMGCL